MSEPLLEVNDVEAGYGEALVLRGVSLTAFEAELVAIIGPNGAGKSTLLKVIYGLLRPTAGKVLYRNDDVTGVRPERLTRIGLNYVPQLGNVFPSLSIAENLLVGSVSLPRAERRPAVNDMYVQFPLLAERRRQRAGTLSGGQRKLLDFARVLMAEPRLVLLDEPMAGVNPALGRQLIEHVLQLRTEAGMTFLFVEHDLDIVMEASDQVIVMNEGRVIASGDPEQVRGDQRVVDAYLGTAGPQ